MIIKLAGVELQEIWGGVAGEPLAAFDLCRFAADGKYYRAHCVEEAKMPGIVLAAVDIPQDGMGKFIRQGKVQNNYWNFTPGKIVFAGENGALTHDFPGSGQQLQQVGLALAVNTLDFNPNIMLIEVA